MGHRQLAIALGVAALLNDRFGAQLAFHRGRDAHDKGARRHILGDHRPCCYEGTRSNGHAIEDHCADANQAAVFKAGAVHDSSVTNGHIGANQYGLAWIAMQYGSVLHIGALPHPDGADITPGNGQGPEAGSCSKVHIPNQHGGFSHPCIAVNVGLRPGEGGHADGDHGAILRSWAREL